MIVDLFKKSYLKIHDIIYDFKIIKEIPSVWIEKNIYLTSDISRYTGYFKYDVSPYTREVVDCLSTTSPVEMVAVMKCAQSGFTQGVIIPGIAYIISEIPAPILYTAADSDLVKLSIRTRLDPVLNNSGLSHLIRPNVVKKKNQRTGDTDFSKEFAGGSLTALGVNNPNKWRQYSVKNIFADDWESAPRSDKKEGNVRSLMENRATSFGSMKKLYYISTPAIKQTSNIEEVYLLGDQRKWNWKCPNCETFIPIEWQIKKEDGTYSGIKWELNEKFELIPESVHYECQNCGGKIHEKDKQTLNLKGKWIPTEKPKRPQFRSYQLNAIVIPPGFTSWIDLVYKWLDACPPNGFIDNDKLKAFVNTQLGQTWEDKGTIIKVSELMNNTRSYNIGNIPDITCEKDGNGKIVLLTLACDLGGIMNDDIEDVRLDWEIIAHTSNGQTYNINHGSIGTFKRGRKKTKSEISDDTDRVKYTYNHGNFGENLKSVWPELKKIIDDGLNSESGKLFTIDMTVIDTGHFTRLAYEFIQNENNHFVVGVKGYEDGDYRKNSKDTPIISRSKENYGKLFILQVNQLKDIFASNIKLRMGMDGYQPSGFMNFPQPEQGKYTMRGYFSHLEAEKRVPVEKDGVEVGFAWKKKSTSIENHYLDVNIYNLAAKEIFIDILRKSSSKYSKLTFEDYAQLLE